MKQKVNKICWRIGQEITPDTFIQADNYICSQHNLIRRLIADKCYGLLPDGEADFAVKANLNNKDFYFEQLVCCGTTEAGYLVLFANEWQSSLPKRQLSITHSNANAFYVVLRINPYEQVLIEPVENDEAPMAHAAYELDIRELDKIAANELALIKIDNTHSSPLIANNYMPPCMSVNACAKLLETYELLKQLLTEIHSHIKRKDDIFGKISYPLAMLYDELYEFPLSSPPIALLRLIKKIILTCQLFIADIRAVDLPDLIRTYNHNDMSLTFNSLLNYLQTVNRIVGQSKEEDFTPRI